MSYYFNNLSVKLPNTALFFNDGDVVTLKENSKKIYMIDGLGREENVLFPDSASYGLIEINLKLNLNDTIESNVLKFLCYLNMNFNVNINYFVNKNMKIKRKNINILQLEKIGKIDGKIKAVLLPVEFI
jgi:hypothetical protein